MKRFLSTLLFACLAAAVMGLTACAGAPTAGGVAVIQNACAIDAGIRPTVSVLLVLATPQESAAVTAARAVIDPVCANPSGSYEANTISAVTAASAQVLSVVTTLQARKAHAPAAAASATVSGEIATRVTA